ncbi:DUF4365 domain-containing protein [Pedobacter agri]|uniref:DUF4365 domain-containing protein n=1 Tax=Pedobacter agri TaxID=454586 RepID=A0A9X3DCC7_9SPHI|nr:DUF4365 domain-containing protein [Pedobacter agri]MCX3265103.1 DUF4365 domain-containing protein [Pedobacter agri]
MTIEQIKEQLSNRFIGIIASFAGFSIDKGDLDLGVDFTLKKSYSYINSLGKVRHTYDGTYIDLQLKSTTENSVIVGSTSIKYDLEVKAYNDLIERQLSGNAPLVLILFVLPYDQTLWVDIDNNEIRLRKNAFWYTPAVGATPSLNSSTIRIEIPNDNILGLDFFNNLHKKFYP